MRIILILLVFLSGCAALTHSKCYRQERVCQEKCQIESRECRNWDYECYKQLQSCLGEE